MKLLINFLAILSLLFPPLPQRGGQVIISPAPVSGGNTNASWVQTCSQASASTSSLSVTIAVGTGTLGCQTTFTAGNCLVLDYSVYSASDLVVGGLSGSGATITWHKAGSVNSSGSTAYDGSFYSCGADIGSPTSSILITVANSGGTYWGFTLTEVHGPTALDTGGFVSNTGTSGATLTVGPSGTLTNTNEYVDVFARAAGSFQTLTAGSCFGGTCTLPANGQPGIITMAMEYIIPSATTAGSAAFGDPHSGDSYGMIMTILK
jgi:hypothetical protein